MIAAMDELIQSAGEKGVQEIVPAWRTRPSERIGEYAGQTAARPVLRIRR